MTQAELRVSILADISQLERALTAAEKLLVQHQENYNSVSRSISQTSSRMREIGREAQNLRSAFNSGKISADQFEKEMNQLNKEVRQLDVEMAGLTREQTRLSREMQRVTRVVQQQRGGFSEVADGTQQASQGMRQMARTATVNAVPAMTSVSQIVQDMPYGISGVANNIQQLTMQMGWLTTQAGGTRQAMSALVGSLWGPGGMLFAVSVVTAALVEYEGAIREAFGSSNRLAEATKEHTAAALADASNLRVLMGLATNYNASIEARRKAIEELNTRYGKYLGNLDEEKIKTDQTREAVDALTKALIQQAQVRGIEGVISEITGEAAEDLTELQIKHREAWDEIRKTLKDMERGSSYWGMVIRDSDDVLGTLRSISGLQEEWPASLRTAVGTWQELSQEIKDVEANAIDAVKPFEDLKEALLNEIFQITVLPEFDQDAIELKGTKPVRVPIEPLDTDWLRDLNPADLNPGDWMADQLKKLEALRAEYPRLSKEYLELTERINALKLAMGDLGWAGLIETEGALYKFAKESSDAADDIERSAMQMQRAIESAIQGMIRSLFDGKFEVEDFVKSILASFASVAVTNMLLPGGGVLGSLFGGGAQATSFRTPQINTSMASASMTNGAQLSVGVPNVRIDGQDLLVVFGRAQQNKNRIG